MGKGYKIGEVGWDEDDVAQQRVNIPFLKMEYKKTYKVRVLSKPYRYYNHWVQTAKGQVKVNCALENCPACGDEGPKLNRFIRAILKNDNQASEPVVLDVGPQIFKQLKELSQNPSWGPLHEYDIAIKKGKKGDNPLYTIAPEPKTKLTDAEKALAAKINKAEIDGQANPDFIDLDKMCQPWTIDRIKKALAVDGEAAPVVESDDDVFADTKKAEPAKVAGKKKEATVETSDKDDADFLDL